MRPKWVRLECSVLPLTLGMCTITGRAEKCQKRTLSAEPKLQCTAVTAK
jgi:hypothetical protein